jgi:hypothetical protein
VDELSPVHAAEISISAIRTGHVREILIARFNQDGAFSCDSGSRNA